MHLGRAHGTAPHVQGRGSAHANQEQDRASASVRCLTDTSHQLSKIVDVLGTPDTERWPRITAMPEYSAWVASRRSHSVPTTLYRWYVDRSGTSSGFGLFDRLLQYDPERRATAAEALEHPWFAEAPLPQTTYATLLTQTLPAQVALPAWTRGGRGHGAHRAAWAAAACIARKYALGLGLPRGSSSCQRRCGSRTSRVRRVHSPEIGVGLVSGGLLFLVLGIVLFFDATLLALGNVLFLAGIALLIGPQKTLLFFARPQKIRGTVCFFAGMALVFVRWTVLGMMVELVGFLNLFGYALLLTQRLFPRHPELFAADAARWSAAFGARRPSGTRLG